MEDGRIGLGRDRAPLAPRSLDHQSVLGDATDRMHTYLERHYNDGVNYRLHYVTAREAYNIVKAAEDGKAGDPDEYRDYVLPHPFHG